MKCRYSRVLWIAVALAMLPTLRGLLAAETEFPFAVPNALARAISHEYGSLLDRHRQLSAELLTLPLPPKNERSARLGWKVFGYGHALAAEQWIEIDLGAVHSIDAICLIPVDIADLDNAAPGLGFPRRFRVELENSTSGVAVVADHSEMDFTNPGGLPVSISTAGAAARKVRINMTKPWERGIYRAYALGEIMILQGSRNLATGLSGVKVRTSASLEHSPTWSRQNLVDGQSIIGAPVGKSDRPFTHGWESERFSDPSTQVWAQVDLGFSHAIDEIRLVPVKLTDFSPNHGYGFPARFRVEISEDAEFGTAQVVADWSQRPYGNSSFSPVTFACNGKTGRFVRVTAHELWERSEGQFNFALAELQVYHGDKNVALGADVTVHSVAAAAPENFKPSFLTDGQRSAMKLVEWPAWLGELSRRREVQVEIEATERHLTRLQPELRRTVSLSAMALAVTVLLAALAVVIHIRRKQARAVATLQRRIAGDLHDEIGSNLASIAMMAELGGRDQAGITSAEIDEIRRLAADSAAAMRDIVWLTQPGPHDVPQLTERLREAAQRLLKGVEWTFEIEGLESAPTLDVQRHLLLALKEMLNNVLRHASARHVDIRLVVRQRHFTLEVQDDGRGFVIGTHGDGHGLTSLRHRSSLLHGNLELDSQPGHGTRISLSGLLHPATTARPAIA